MKTVTLLTLAVTLLAVMYSRAWPQPRKIHEPLPGDQSNPPLQRIADSATLPANGRIYFRTNYTSSGLIRSSAARHPFPDGAFAPAILVEWNDGKKEWLKRDSVAHLWIASSNQPERR